MVRIVLYDQSALDLTDRVVMEFVVGICSGGVAT